MGRGRRKRQRLGPNGSIGSDPAIERRLQRVRLCAGSLPIESYRFRSSPTVYREQLLASGPVVRKNSRRDRLKPVLVVKTTENWFRSDAMCAGQVVTGQSWGNAR